ncbi:MAG: hypothetical protein ACKVOW_06075 [Chitinophagaceae bacterium]
MRKLLIKVLFISVVAILMYACTKQKNVADFTNLSSGAYVTLVKNGNLILDYGNLSTTSADITVQQLGADIDKIKVYATEGLANFDKTKWKAVKEVAYVGGELQLKVTAIELATGLGIAPAALKTGSPYTFYNELILKDGRVFSSANTNSAFQGISNYKMAMSWQAVVVCPYVAPMAGTYKVITDDWADWNTGDLVTLTDVAGNKLDLSAVWPNPLYGSIVTPLVISLDPATGAATIPANITFGNYGSYNAKTLSGSSGYVFSCTGTVTLVIHVDAGPFGDQGFLKLILKKQ